MRGDPRISVFCPLVRYLKRVEQASREPGVESDLEGGCRSNLSGCQITGYVKSLAHFLLEEYRNKFTARLYGQK